LGFFRIPSRTKSQEIKPEQIFVNRSGTTENAGQENPLTRRPDILVQERDNGQQVPDRNVSGRCLSIRLAFLPNSDHIHQQSRKIIEIFLTLAEACTSRRNLLWVTMLYSRKENIALQKRT